KVYLSFVYRCCHDKLIPLDIHSGVEELKGFIENYMKLAQDSVNTEKLKHYFNEFYQLTDKVITKIKQSKEDDIQKNNELIKSISRVVVRLMQVNTSEFEPDPALPLPPVP